MSAALSEMFPWVEFLPEADRESFLDDFPRTLAASAELDNFAALGRLLREWRATAEVHADPELARRLRTPLKASGGPVGPTAA